MKSIKAILLVEGYDAESMGVGESVSVEPDSRVLMPLVIEKTGAKELSVAHYYSRAGDLVCDPQVHFEIEGQNWTPVRYVQDPHIERADPAGLNIGGFLTIWDRNLRRQGYVDAGRD